MNLQFEEADLVGITAFTSNINRAYEIARMYREKKIKVIMGGIHISMLPDEALQYADAVVIGEVEGIWKQVIDRFRKQPPVTQIQWPANRPFPNPNHSPARSAAPKLFLELCPDLSRLSF